MTRVSRAGEIILAPPQPPANGVDWDRYEVTLCANETADRGPCNRMAFRPGYSDDWHCHEHGRCDTVAFAEAVGGVRVILGYRDEP